VKPEKLSRRVFLQSLSSTARNSCITLTLPMFVTACDQANQARLNNADFVNLSIDEAEEFQAMAARIIPTDQTPGATEAGVVYFIDQVLGDQRDVELALLREGLGELKTSSTENFAAANFHHLEAAQQDQLLTQIEDTEFFAAVRFLTIAGMFSLPEYGGNRDQLGYDTIGFDNRHAWQPPFGFYDADYIERGQ